MRHRETQTSLFSMPERSAVTMIGVTIDDEHNFIPAVDSDFVPQDDSSDDSLDSSVSSLTAFTDFDELYKSISTISSDYQPITPTSAENSRNRFLAQQPDRSPAMPRRSWTLEDENFQLSHEDHTPDVTKRKEEQAPKYIAASLSNDVIEDNDPKSKEDQAPKYIAAALLEDVIEENDSKTSIAAPNLVESPNPRIRKKPKAGLELMKEEYQDSGSPSGKAQPQPPFRTKLNVTPSKNLRSRPAPVSPNVPFNCRPRSQQLLVSEELSATDLRRLAVARSLSIILEGGNEFEP